MKILHIIPSYLPAKFASGAISTVHGFNKWLVKMGIDVTVFTTNSDKYNETLDVPLNKEVNIDGVKVYYFKTSFPKKWYYSYDLIKQLSLVIKNFDIIHITSVFLSVSTIGSYYARKFNKPYIISAYGSLMKNPLKRHSLLKKIYIALIEKKNLANAAAVHFNSQKEKEEYIEAEFPLNKELILFSGLDCSVFNIEQLNKDNFKRKLNIPLSHKVIFYLGRFNWIKGFDTLIPAFKEVVKKRSDIMLVLAGYEDGYESEIRRLIEEYDVGDKIIMPGSFFGKEKNEALLGSDIFILPSYSEAGSIASIEALYFGLPIVITKSCGLAYEISKAGAGLVVEKDVEQVSEAILKILSNSDLAKKMSENGRKLIKNEFSSEKVAEKLIKEYNKIINNS